MKKTEFMAEFMMALKVYNKDLSPLERALECERFWDKHKTDLETCTIEEVFVD